MFEAQCEHGEIRLENGTSELEGLLVLCLNRRWGTVSSDYWYNAHDANSQVVCNQLGFSSAGIYIYIYNNCNNIYDSSKNILKYIIVKYIATYGSSPNAGVFPVDHIRLHCTVVLGQWMLFPTTVL